MFLIHTKSFLIDYNRKRHLLVLMWSRSVLMMAQPTELARAPGAGSAHLCVRATFAFTKIKKTATLGENSLATSTKKASNKPILKRGYINV